ncbi:hypothetical protein APHAL10511_008094 [Amanita phalloides]|nr:hypothetical protein APHAL10511_008094 [Amanita phalloides]
MVQFSPAPSFAILALLIASVSSTPLPATTSDFYERDINELQARGPGSVSGALESGKGLFNKHLGRLKDAVKKHMPGNSGGSSSSSAHSGDDGDSSGSGGFSGTHSGKQYFRGFLVEPVTRPHKACDPRYGGHCEGYRAAKHPGSQSSRYGGRSGRRGGRSGGRSGGHTTRPHKACNGGRCGGYRAGRNPGERPEEHSGRSGESHGLGHGPLQMPVPQPWQHIQMPVPQPWQHVQMPVPHPWQPHQPLNKRDILDMEERGWDYHDLDVRGYYFDELD